MIARIMQFLKVIFGISVVLAILTSVVVIGYVFKIVAFLIAVLCVVILVIFLFWAAIKEFFQSNKKPPM